LLLNNNLIKFCCVLIFLAVVTAACGSQPGAATPSNISEQISDSLTATVVNAGEMDTIQSIQSVNPPPPNINFKQISVDQGLSQSSVLTILQDSNGFMWFGTEDGLNKFDGYEFSVYKHNPEDLNSLSSNTILSLYEDQSGELWIGTSRGLDRFDRNSDTWRHYSLDRVNSIARDKNGVLWVGSMAGLYAFESEPEGLKRVNSEKTFALMEDTEGMLWAGTDDGLIGLDEGGNKVIQFQHNSQDETSIINNIVRVIYEDRQGSMWVGTEGGLDKLDLSNGTFTHFTHDASNNQSISNDRVLSIFQDHSGVLWIGTDGGGLDSLVSTTLDFNHYQSDADSPESLSSNIIQAIYQDQGGVLWIGTESGGINAVDLVQKNFDYYQYDASEETSLSNNFITSIFEENPQVVWIGTGGGGLNRLDRFLDNVNYYQHDPGDEESISDDYITSIYVDRDGMLWVGTADNGLNGFDRSIRIFTRYYNDPADDESLSHNSVSSLLEDRQGVLWVGTQGGGLDAFDRESGKFSHYYDLNSKFINTLYEDQDGSLWVGTSNTGLNHLDPMKNTFTHYGHDPYDPNSISSDNVLSIIQDNKGIFWIGTGGGGLNRFDLHTGNFKYFREKDGLANDVVYGILQAESGELWLSTNNGLSKFDPETEIFRNYDIRDGLQSNEFNQNAFFRNRQGEMFFGGINGLNVFNPQHIHDNPIRPPIRLTTLRQAGGDIDLEQAVENITEVTFQWPNNFFEFEFAALSYSHPDKNQYAYKLEGLHNEDWNYIGTRRFGRYTNLPGGTYTLRLKGSNNDGVWNELETPITVTIVPPIWATWWFQGLAVLILVVGIVAGIRFRVKNIQARTEELESQVADRTRELAALNTIASVVSSSLETEKILHDALEKVLELMQIEAGGIYMLKEGSETLSIRAHKGLSDDYVAEVDDLMIGEGFSGRVVQSGEPLVVEDVTNDPRVTRTIVKEEAYHTLVVLPLISGGKVLGAMFLISRQDREFTKKEIELLVAIGGQIGGAVENARFYKEEHRRSEQFMVLAEVGRRVSSILDVNEVLEEVVRLIQSTFGYYHVALGLIEGDEVVYRIGSGELWDNPKFKFKPARLKIGREGLSGWVAATGRLLVVPDVSQESRYIWMHGSQTRSEVTVPILVKGRVIGVLDVQSDQVDAFDETDLAVLQSLAHQAGAAIENARLYEQAQQAAVLEERARLARELHDAVTQTLFSASLLAEALPASWENNHEEGEKLLEELKHLNRGALAEMRTLLIELRPSALVEANFGDLLLQLAEAASGREGLPIQVAVDCKCVLPPDVHIALYRIAQEALNNVVKHAKATKVNVQIGCSVCVPDDQTENRPKIVSLMISDNGRGFNQDHVKSDHLGLGIMHERAEDIGAQLKIESSLGSGTVVRVEWQENDDGKKDFPQLETEISPIN
jgi:ligand-binding sensor domain-containing protein/nitrate/nitrite-specific signal transduction histidine kinase